MDLDKLTLKISPRAREHMLRFGGEFYIATREINVPGSPLGKMNLSVANIGRPKEPELCVKTEEDGITVWTSRLDAFIRNEIAIDLYAVGYLILPICLSTIIISCGEGGCESCGIDCPSRA